MRMKSDSYCGTHNPQGRAVCGSFLEFQFNGTLPITRSWAVLWGLLVCLIIKGICTQIKKSQTNDFPQAWWEGSILCGKYEPLSWLLSSQGCRVGANNIDCSINLLSVNPSFTTEWPWGSYPHNLSVLICQVIVRTASPMESCCVGPIS